MRSLLPAAVFAALLAIPPALAGTFRDEEYGVALDLGDGWDVTTSPKESPGGKLGRAMARLGRGEAAGWVVLFGNAPVDPAKDGREGARLAAFLLSSRYEALGERMLPGIARPADFGRAGGILLEYEVAPAKGEGRTRVGRAAFAAVDGKLHLAFAERPATGADAAEVRELERLVASFRVGEPISGRRGEAPQAAPSIPATAGDSLPSPEFRSSVDTVRIVGDSSGLEVFRQYYLFEGQKLPSYVCHLLGKEYERDGQKGKTPELLLLIVNNTKGKTAVRLRAEVQLLEYSQPATRTILALPGQTAFAAMSPVFSDSIYDLAEQRPGAIRLRITDAENRGLLGREKVLHESTERVVLLGRNDFFWRDTQGRSWAPAMAAFVTPHDKGRRVDGLLKRAADLCPFKAMVGYQEVGGATHAQVVARQLGAIYDALADGYRYVNAPMSMDTRAQRIKYPGETIEDRSGNCIETVLVFAAAVESTGMNPVVVLFQDHAIVAVRSWKDEAPLIALETTMCGRAPFADAQAEGDRKLRAGLKSSKPPELVDIRDWRKSGFTPAPR